MFEASGGTAIGRIEIEGAVAGRIEHDTETGWVTWQGEPRWRSTGAALRRLAGADVRWLRHRGHRIAHLGNGTPVAVLRNYPATRRWMVVMEGFEFFGPNRVLGTDMWAAPKAFDRLDDARSFAETVLRQAHASIRRGIPAKGRL